MLIVKMKIPETSANVGAYYGNEENGQWQPNGVVVDTGVGGGVVGSGDAGHYHSIPPHTGHIQGYMVATGGYYGTAVPPYASAPPDDFADYMWMENEEEFDKQVMQQLEEEALMEQCIEAMLEDEQRERHTQNPHYPTTSNGASLAEAVSRSTLNPLAAEFVPAGLTNTEDKQESPPTEPTHTKIQPEPAPNTREPPVQETPEASALIQQKDSRKSPKIEAKKTKPQTVKSDTKVQPKKEVKAVKSEVKVEEIKQEVQEEVIKPQPSPIEETGPKPINYAAAARANKPKKLTPILVTPSPVTPVTPAPATPAPAPADRRVRGDRPPAKTQHRKNSAK